MTADEIAKLRELCAMATPGPWEAVTCREGKHHIHAPEGPAVDEIATFWGRFATDVEFCAAARTGLLSALNEIERLRNELAKQQQATFRLCSEEETRLRDMVIGLGLDPDAGRK